MNIRNHDRNAISGARDALGRHGWGGHHGRRAAVALAISEMLAVGRAATYCGWIMAGESRSEFAFASPRR